MECLACHTDNHEGARFCAKCGAPLPVQKGTETDPLIGQTIGGRYKILGILGEGGMGRVYAGEQQMGTTVRKVAVKTLLSQYAKDPKTVGRFMREVGTVSELEHPNTIKVFDFGKIEGSGDLYIAMELLQGKSLEDVLAASRPLPPERVDRIIGQVCGSLQEAHDKGIVHRDLKPANIFLTTRAGEEDVVKVLDFGIAKGATESSKNEQKLTQQGTILGTPPYMSPEQFTGKELDGRSDVYSLGILAYEMLTGRLPFEAETAWQWMTLHSTEPPLPFEAVPAAAGVPDKMRRAVLHALAKDPADRPATVRDLYEELTLGNTRLSALGLASGGVAAIPPSVLPAPSAGAPRAGGRHTEIGAPINPFDLEAAGAPGFGPGQTATGAMDPIGHYGVPTAGGQAFPVPPREDRRSGNGPLVAAAIALGVIGLGAGVFYWRSQSVASSESDTSGTEEPEPIPIKTSTKSAAPPPTDTTPTAPPPPTVTAPPALPGHTPLPTDDEWAAQPQAKIQGGDKLGCEARTLREWARVVCRDATSAAVDKGAEKGDTFTGTSGGAASFIYPFSEGSDLAATFTWPDKTAAYKVLWPKGAPKPPLVGVFAAAKPTKPAATTTATAPPPPRPTATATATATTPPPRPTATATSTTPPPRPTATTPPPKPTATSTGLHKPTRPPKPQPTATATSTSTAKPPHIDLRLPGLRRPKK